ncbi:GntR family transcriptional regulator [Streptomyces sp. NPDC005921]|uniref:GntR family transcriptional regulator n=1 Tax=Streptomyces sp. NPDC005827 TaxID=3157070 RepID=UPI0033E5EAFD
MAEGAGRASAAQTVYAVTKELILSGELAAGTLISEGEIAERVQVSRTPVREAFLRLESEELLALHPKRGAVVVPVPAGEAADVLELRQALEQSAAQRIARHGLVRESEDGLRGLIARQRELAQVGDVHAFAAADEAFHRGIVEASGNRLASRFYAALGDRQRRMSVSVLQPRPQRLHVLADEHETLLGHLVTKAADTFAETLRAHLAGTHGTPGRPGGDR